MLGLQDEIFAVVDENDQIIGQATRQDCHSDRNLIHRSVHIIITNSAEEIFFQKRSLTKDVSPGQWTLSATGHVDLGETYEQAAERELFEELGIKTSLRTLGSFLLDYSREQEFTRVFTGHHEGPFTLLETEISEGRFLAWEKMLALHHAGELKLARPAIDIMALAKDDLYVRHTKDR
ncbi:hypothetical protein AUK40_00810 [Candidatus Wirthbacteria bacterium CG2_30_54_11]|uniref:Nudix hydrolase domain-containing protein n=1 Tax=Candidatus Wirthbacteria bacterium CG2_30_54_11 TaxID=1817892 RepID=A0A1J5IXJ9_9BACT|nr:MAG: hypothetical protein AUK40_00810 [Candidatus Wirthbacteria bacterium CG2_30_54_11]